MTQKETRQNPICITNVRSQGLHIMLAFAALLLTHSFLFFCTDDNLNMAKNTDRRTAIATNKYIMQISVFSSTDIPILYKQWAPRHITKHK